MPRSCRRRSISLLCPVFLLCWLPAKAQVTANLSGHVTDQTGAPVTGASVSATNTGTNMARTTTTDRDGRYQFASLPVGRYEMRISKSGFREQLRSGIALVAGPDTTADISMQRTTPDACASGHEFLTTDCTLTWHGITVYGAYDAGLGWVSHGLPNNGYNYEGESLVNRNGYKNMFLLAPNNQQQTGLGVRAKEEFAEGWAVVFNASSGINPQSGLLANAPATQTANNGLPRAAYTFAIDGARAGQPFNDEIYGGVSSKQFGTVTFGRQRSLGTDAMLVYDPAGGAYAFSYIGYNLTLIKLEFHTVTTNLCTISVQTVYICT